MPKLLTPKQKHNIVSYHRTHPHIPKLELRLHFQEVYNRRIAQSTLYDVIEKDPERWLHYFDNEPKKSVCLGSSGNSSVLSQIKQCSVQCDKLNVSLDDLKEYSVNFTAVNGNATCERNSENVQVRVFS